MVFNPFTFLKGKGLEITLIIPTSSDLKFLNDVDFPLPDFPIIRTPYSHFISPPRTY